MRTSLLSLLDEERNKRSDRLLAFGNQGEPVLRDGLPPNSADRAETKGRSSWVMTTFAMRNDWERRLSSQETCGSCSHLLQEYIEGDDLYRKAVP